MVKNMQKWASKIRIILMLVVGTCPFILHANQALLDRADSLYSQKKFSEAREVYFQLYEQGFSSPATLLKMALVHEGLGETGQALFFLSAYYRETEDQKAYEKILTVANARGVQGYELKEWEKLTIWINNRMSIYLPISIAIAVLFMAIMIFNAKRANTNAKFAAGFVSLLFIGLSFSAINFLQPPDKAVITAEVYFMSGPSAAANLISLIPAGNQVKLTGEQDIWAEAEWNGKTGFLRKTDLLKTRQ
jgi:hypothetical protein